MELVSKSVHIEKLCNKDQWDDWKFCVRLALIGANAFDVVDGSLVSNSENAAQFHKKDNNAQVIIGTSLGPGFIKHVKHCTTAKAMWDTLLGICEKKDNVRKARVQALFWNFKIEATEDIVDVISRLNDVVAQLSGHGDVKTDEDRVIRLIGALPAQYRSFCSAWESTPEKERTYANLTERLITEQERRGLGHKDEEKRTEALFAGQRTCSCRCVCGARSSVPKEKYPNKKPPQKKQVRCYGCKELGHIKVNCPAAKKKRRERHLSVDSSEALSCVTDGQCSGGWILDTGASHHICPDESRFTNYCKFDEKRKVVTAGGELIWAVGQGNVQVMAHDGIDWRKRVLVGALHVPGSKFNLFSLSQCVDKGCKMTAGDSDCVITRGNVNVAIGVRRGNLFELKFKYQAEAVANVAVKLSEWHRRLGHQGNQHVEKILRKCGVDYVKDEVKCVSCIKGKADRIPFPKRDKRAKSCGEYVHADLCGPMDVESLGGARYYLLIKDEFSHFRFLYTLKKKSEAAEKIMDYVTMVERQQQVTLKVLRTDNGGEFVNKVLGDFLMKKGIIHQTTIPYTPQQNGCVERENRTVMNAVRTMLDDSGLGKELWAEAANMAVYLLNMTGTSAVASTTPYELWSGECSVRVDDMRAFGSRVYVHIAKEERKKLDLKANECVYVGPGINKKGFRCFDKNTRVVVTVRNVTFVEQEYVRVDIPSTSTDVRADDEPVKPKSSVRREKDNNLCDVTVSNIIEGRLRNRGESGFDLSEQSDEQSDNDPDYEDAEDSGSDDESMVLLTVGADEPTSYSEASKGHEAVHWKAAMMEEIESLERNGTWTLVNDDHRQKIVDNRWVFKKKLNSEGVVVRYKARLVARGFSQIEGVDYYETFSPVMRMQTFRIMLVIAAARKLKIRFFDVTSAFLNGRLEEKVLMRQPDGFSDNTGRVCLLRRSLYGLKQASRCWNRKFVHVIGQFGLKQSKNDPCVFVRARTEDVGELILGIYVDDGLIIAEDEKEIEELLHHLMQHFNLKTHGGDQFLGMEVKMEEGHIALGQRAFAERIVRQYHMADSFPVSTPFNPNRSLVSSSSHSSAVPVTFPYRQAVGSLNYLAVATRPDIAYAVGVAARFLANPDAAAVNLVKDIIRYVKGTVAYELRFEEGEITLDGYCDADYAGCPRTRRSTSGQIFMVAGGSVSWRSKRQPTVAQSTAEAEYVAAAEACKELVWLKRLLKEMAGMASTPVLWIDNKSAVFMTNNPGLHQFAKHIEIRYHYIREMVARKRLITEHVKSDEQLADALTKPLNGIKIRRFCSEIKLKAKL